MTTATRALTTVSGTRRRTRIKPERYRYNTRAGKVFDVFNFALLTAIGLVALFPFVFVLVRSFAPETELESSAFFLWPKAFTFEAYNSIFSTPAFPRALITTVVVTAVGTVVQLFLTVLMAYPLSKRGLPGRNIIMSGVVFAMVFSGGMIPTFLVVKNLGLLNNYLALILPLAIDPFSLIIIKNFFQNLPSELEEAARVDGATDFGVFWRVALPLSKPVLATFALFYAVAIWNDYMSPLLYLNDSSMWTLQMFLQQVTSASNLQTAQQDQPGYIPPSEGVKYAVVVVSTIPVLIFYPFLQKHFAKGMLIGAVKG
ncbi:carbohydrate ABC transporter permease [Humibacter sp.]|uniref:carbohydrate ABC transporter permease n=1 Tax=Humibacter sp. TaxID=1940291 RepID=UPI003F81268B